GEAPSTATSAGITLVSGEISTDAGGNIAYLPLLGSIGDYVWEDSNADGIQDAGELGIAGITVRLLDGATSSVLAVTTTGLSGEYSFTDLSEGEYIVEFANADAYENSPFNAGTGTNDSDAGMNGQSSLIGLGYGEYNGGIDAGYYQLASVSDVIWQDLDGDGVQDANEPGIGGLVLVILEDENGTEIGTTTTDSNGGFEFTGLEPGSYTIVAPNEGVNGEAPSTATSAGITLVSGETSTDTGVNIAYLPLLGSIGDLVWEDSNADGIQDADELGIEGITVHLLDGVTNALIETTTTSATGTYNFIDVNEGEYIIEFVVTDGYQTTLINAGDGTNDNDVNANGQSALISIGYNESNADIDAGFYQLASVNGVVWQDLDGNDEQSPNEIGMEGMMIYLLTPSDVATILSDLGNVVDSVMTDSNGYYEFTNLLPKTYTIEAPEVGTNGELPITPITVDVTLSSGEQGSEINFAYFATSEINGQVWFDEDRDDNQDDTESGLAEVPVVLTNSEGVIVATVLTDAEGNYNFTEIPVGNYTVSLPDTLEGGLQVDEVIPSVINIETPNATITTIFSYIVPVPLGTIGSFVWEDSNGDGQANGGEFGIPNALVYLLDGTGAIVGVTTTDETGYYEFPELPPGNYTTYVDPTSVNNGLGLNTPSTGIVGVGGGNETGISFGFAPSDFASVGNNIWVDENENGLQDEGEIGLVGVEVNLFDIFGNLMETTTTDESGFYFFDGLVPESYYIELVPPEGYEVTEQGTVENTDGDSNVNDDGISDPFNLLSGENRENIDAGFVPIQSTVLDETPTELCTQSGVQTDLCSVVEEGEIIVEEGIFSLFNCGIELSASDEDCVSFTPCEDFEGLEIISVLICQESNLNLCREEVFFVTVGCIAPYVENDIVSIVPTGVIINSIPSEDTSGYDGVNIDITANDEYFCTEAENISINIVEQPVGGALTLNPDMSLDYTPYGSFSGLEMITYEMCNACGACEQGIVRISVERLFFAEVNDCETPEYEICTSPLQPIQVCPDFCLDNDYTVTEANTTFSCSITEQETCIQYTALPAFYGTEIIEVIACEVTDPLRCDTAYVTVNVMEDCNAPENQAPLALDDEVGSADGEAIMIDIMANDMDMDEDPLTIATYTQPMNGTVVILEDGMMLYTPNEGFEGFDEFTYQICDTFGSCDEGQVNITVTLPVIPCSDTLQVCAEPVSPILICPEFCNLNPDMGIAITSAHTTFNCSLDVVDNNCIQYTALPMFIGEELVTIVACTVDGVCDTTYLQINVVEDCNNVEVGEGEGETGTSDGLGGVFVEDSPVSGKEEMLAKPLDKASLLSLNALVPNPARNFISVSFTGDKGAVTIQVLDLTGRLITTQTRQSLQGVNTHRLDLENYPVGIYTVRLQMNQQVVHGKFVKN
ncbi:MAG: SdrD B-like domain-containing protein, partial [Chitinophagales bacterium]